MIRLNLVLILEILWEVRELIFEGFYAELPFQDELKFLFSYSTRFLRLPFQFLNLSYFSLLFF